MPRLTKKDWERARAQYEVEGVSLRQIANEYDVDPSAVSRRSAAEGWEQGKSQHIVNAKVEALSNLAAIEEEKSLLPIESQRLVDILARKELEAQDIGADLKKAILSKSKTMLAEVTEPHHVLTLAKTHSELLKQPAPQNQIAVVNGGGQDKQDSGPKLELVLNQPPDGGRTRK